MQPTFSLRLLLRLAVLLLAVMLLGGCGASDAAPPNGGAAEPAPAPGEADTPTPDPLSEPSGGGAGEVPPPSPVPTLTPIHRLAEFAYPEWMQLKVPREVRFSLFSEGNEPVPWRGATATPHPVTLSAMPGLEVWVLVRLDVVGADARADTGDQPQLLTTRNTWRWKVTATNEEEVSLQPQILIEYRDAMNQVRARSEVPWPYSYTVSKIGGPNPLDNMGDWLSRNVFQLFTLLFGPAMPVIPTLWRQGRRALIKRGIIKPGPGEAGGPTGGASQATRQ
jgi:hypothetical protein